MPDDPELEGVLAGARSAGPGRWQLLDGGRTVAEGRLERPNDGVVTDAGTWAIVDWLFDDALRGVVLVGGPDGRIRINERFEANIHQCFLSPDGLYAAVQCAVNNDSADDSLFVLYDVASGGRLWARALEVGRVDAVRFLPDEDLIEVTARDWGTVPYSLSGGWTDQGALRDIGLELGDGYVVMDLVRAELDEGPVKLGRQTVLLAALGRAVPALAAWPRQAAKAERLTGDLLEAAGDEARALAAWDRALALDPAVGVRKRAESLRAKLATAG